MISNTGIFTISLDFELHWGVRDKRTLNECRENLAGARKAIPVILESFSNYGIHATWATVGFLFFRMKSDLMKGLPSLLPEYADNNLSPYNDLDMIGEDEETDPYHYASSLVMKIRELRGQEIASHTFSHYYCLEEGQTQAAFRADLEAAQAAANSLGIELHSLVFPRNQCNREYLATCSQAGITSYRGNERSWMYGASDGAGQSLLRRLARLSDSYFMLSGYNCYSMDDIGRDLPIEIPSSRFLRPVSRALAVLEPLRLYRIKSAMTHAAKRGQIYHLWWHPHNFGKNTASNIDFLEQILKHYQFLSQQYGMRSMNMGEITRHLLSPIGMARSGAI